MPLAVLFLVTFPLYRASVYSVKITDYRACDLVGFMELVHRSDRQFYSEDDLSSPIPRKDEIREGWGTDSRDLRKDLAFSTGGIN